MTDGSEWGEEVKCMHGGQQFITTAASLGCSPWLQRDLVSYGFSKRDKL